MKSIIGLVALALLTSIPMAMGSDIRIGGFPLSISNERGTAMSNTTGCGPYGCVVRLKEVGYAPEYQEAIGLLQAVKDGVAMPPISPVLREAMTAEMEKMAKDGIAVDALTDVQIVEALVKSKAAAAQSVE